MRIIKLNATGSTNDYLKALHKEVFLEDEVFVLAHHQESGKGQFGSQWYSEEGKSLTCSLFKRYSGLDIKNQFTINWAVAIAVFNALSLLKISNLSMKWPNDIMAGSKNLGGILIENQVQTTRIGSSVIGLGLNVSNQMFPNLAQATSISEVTFIAYSVEEVFEVIARNLLYQLNRIPNTDPSMLRLEYESLLFKKDKVSVFETPSEGKFNGIIRGVSSQGELKIEKEDETTQLFQLKEIKLHY